MNQINLPDTIFGGALGFTFGFVLNKSQTHKPRVIREQFELKDFTVLKTFTTSVATGCLGMAVTNLLGYTAIRVKPTYAMANMLGGAMVGAGAYISGATLETVLAQLGVGRKRAAMVLLGSLTGAFGYGFMDKSVRDSFLGNGGEGSGLHTLLNLPFAYVAIPAAALLAGAAYMMDIISPSKKVIDETTPGTKPPSTLLENSVHFLQKETWSPYVCGVLIGLLQIPTAIYTHSSMFGIGAPYFGIAATAAGLMGFTNVFFNAYKAPGLYWTYPLACETVCGSWVAEQTKKGTTKTSKIKVPLNATQQIASFVGGVLVGVGSGIAVGSPSVHGLSGLSQLSIGSMISIASMFGGGVITAQLLHDQRHRL